MSKSVDERVVKMSFDNKEFENGARTSMDTIRRLKDSLNFSAGKNGLNGLAEAAKSSNLSPLANSIETIRTKFSALEVVGVTALANLTNSAVNAGKRIVGAFTIDPIKTGFQEYETQINAIQTVLANTEEKGTTLEDVNKTLDELNTYADKTIYNFTQMTKNIGTFTAAGIGLEDSASAIQGIANLAAVSGSNAQQASTAMYQLSQALAAGSLKLQDWNSVVNASMGGQVFQTALKETAKEMGADIDAIFTNADGSAKSFRETLEQGWITTDVLTTTLKKMTKSGAVEYLAKLSNVSVKEIEAAQKEVDANNNRATGFKKIAKEIAAAGNISAKQAEKILKLASNAEDAATKVKTFTQLKDTLAEAAQSGWTQSWEYIIGDFEQAKELFTVISDTLGDLINKSSDARNKILKGWMKHGGRDTMIDAMFNLGRAAKSIGTPIKEAFSDVFPKTTYQDLIAFSDNFRKFTRSLVLTDSQMANLKETFKGLFGILHGGKTVIEAVFKPFIDFASSNTMSLLKSGFLTITGGIGKIFQAFDEGVSSSTAIEGINGALTSLLNGFGATVELLGKAFSGVIKKFSTFCDGAEPLFDGLMNLLGKAFKWIQGNITIEDLMVGLVGGNVFVLLNSATEAINKFTDSFTGIFDMFKKKGTETGGNFKTVMKDISEGLGELKKGVNVMVVGTIAVSVSSLANAIKTLASIPTRKAAAATAIVAGISNMLVGTLIKMLAAVKKITSVKGAISATFTVIALARSVSIMAGALKKIDGIKNPGTSLLTLAGTMGILVTAMNRMNSLHFTLGTGAVMIGFATLLNQIAKPLKELGEMSWSEVARSLTAMGGAVFAMIEAVQHIDKMKNPKGMLSGGATMLLMAISMKSMAKAMKDISSMSWDEVAKGVSGMGIALGELTICVKYLGDMQGWGSIKGGVAVKIMSTTLMPIAEAMKTLATMSWDEIGKSVSSMGIAIGALSIAIGYLGEIEGFGTIIGGAAVWVVSQALLPLAQALTAVASMSWDEIGKSLLAIGGCLGVVAFILPKLLGAVSVFKEIAGLNTLLNAGAILVVALSLGKIAEALNALSMMSWDGIGKGLSGMSIALFAMVGAIKFLGDLEGFGSLIGGTAVLIVSQALMPIANSLVTLSSLSWEEIGKAVSAMGIALAELAITTEFLGSSALLSLIGAGSIKLLTSGLMDLANAFGKFASLSWDEIKNGLAAMGGALSELALGGFVNSFAILGDAAIATIAKPLGDLADSIIKWKDIEVPEHLVGDMVVLADAVGAFLFKGMGASALAKTAPAIGILGESLAKWKKVEVPETIADDLKRIASGVEGFMFAFSSGFSIDVLNEPLAELATSVSKWKNVRVPETLGTDLEGLANGLKGFSWIFTAGWSLSTVAEPLGVMAESISKWKNVEVPDTVPEGIKKISEAISDLSIIGAKKISGIGEPLKDLSDALETMSKLKGDASNMNDICANVKQAVESLSELNIPIINNSAVGLGKLADALDRIASVDTSVINKFVKRVNNLNNIQVGEISVDTKQLSDTVDAVKNTIKDMKGTMTDSKEDLNSGMTFALSGLKDTCESQGDQVINAMKASMRNLVSSVKEKKTDFTSAFATLMAAGKTAVTDYKTQFSDAGGQLGDGLIIGIRGKESEVYAAAYHLGEKAVEGEHDGQESHSPSKATIRAGKWLGLGLIIGMERIKSAVYSKGKKTGSGLVNAIQNGLKTAENLIDEKTTNPTIKPVIDLTNAQIGAERLKNMFGEEMQISNAAALNKVNRTVGRDKVTSDQLKDVVDVVGKVLHASKNESKGNTYQIAGITYDDGSVVGKAIDQLIKAARIERRV